jgi:hypothetical protein
MLDPLRFARAHNQSYLHLQIADRGLGIGARNQSITRTTGDSIGSGDVFGNKLDERPGWRMLQL